MPRVYVIILALTNGNYSNDLIVFYGVQPWIHWLGLLTFNMLQYSSFTHAIGSLMSFLVTVLERRIQFHALQSTEEWKNKAGSQQIKSGFSVTYTVIHRTKYSGNLSLHLTHPKRYILMGRIPLHLLVSVTLSDHHLAMSYWLTCH